MFGEGSKSDLECFKSNLYKITACVHIIYAILGCLQHRFEAYIDDVTSGPWHQFQVKDVTYSGTKQIVILKIVGPHAKRFENHCFKIFHIYRYISSWLFCTYCWKGNISRISLFWQSSDVWLVYVIPALSRNEKLYPFQVANVLSLKTRGWLACSHPYHQIHFTPGKEVSLLDTQFTMAHHPCKWK